jgi:predicted hydrocarbon binding protein
MGLATILKKMLIGRAFATERGRIKLFGRTDWTMQPAVSLAYVLQQIGEKNGEDFLFKLGYESGKLGAKEIMDATGTELKGDRFSRKLVTDLLEFIGEGRMEFLRSRIEKDGHHHVVIIVRDNPTTEHAYKMYGRKSKVCAFFRGVYSAHGEVEFGAKNVRLKENKCVCKGAPYCEWESKW